MPTTTKLTTPEWRLADVGEDVYEPSEDTFLLLDALEAELPWLQERHGRDQNSVEADLPWTERKHSSDENTKEAHLPCLASRDHNTKDARLPCLASRDEKIKEARLPWRHGSLVVELGMAGLVITAMAQALQGRAHCVAVDINPEACRATKATAQLNNAQVEVIRGDLLDCLQPGCIDLLIFNPPYVVTHPDEIHQGDGINRSYAGGIRGRQVMDRLFPQLPRLMAPRSCVYMIVIDENDPQQIAKLLEDLGFESSVVMSRRAGIERLSVMKFVRL
ncbi:LOW QUALITY PROTEIN: methyltransferase N6AMT1-like [Nilaparvata lugens]|uniref:LOW QUALITY PROTEIN: methyltransferase N6AMT1-like n=1 Tax=Nilaparvata lugens TaxID=108931 RepID=UPI00193D5F95|nr:LOW QUALITY PROTEIN: methyltransferase N6AMT1-like [Nilaparvata lugens]